MLKPAPIRRRTPRAAVQRGVVMIEILVALLIFMLGVLGLVGMQSRLTQTQTESKLRADAAYLASEALARMWTHIDEIANFDGADRCEASSCTEWRTKVGQVLPGGDAAITVDSSTGDVSITITWTLPDGQTHRYVTQSTVVPKSI